MKTMKNRLSVTLLIALLALVQLYAREQRRATPVNNAATATQAVNETKNDTARIYAAKRAAAGVTFVNDNGFTVYVDSISGEEWIDSTSVRKVPKMEFPLFHSLSVGLNLWDPLMRAFGQHYGVADAQAQLWLHNRYAPTVEVGLGQASDTPSGMNFTYRSPVSVYFRIGADYNFLFNSNPDYMVFAGVRYGFSPFSYSVDNISLDSPYWDETAKFNIPSQHATAGWFEVGFGLRVKLWGPVSAGWSFKYRSILHESKAKYGEPWYIPGFGARGSSVSGTFSVVYTIPLQHLNKPKADAVSISESLSASPETSPEE